MLEVNALAETLREQRLGALEATALLRKVMAEIDVAVFTFDGDAAAAAASTAPASGCSGAPRRAAARPHAAELGLDGALAADAPHRCRPALARAARAAGRCGARTFRQGGCPHELLVLTDVSQPLRERGARRPGSG